MQKAIDALRERRNRVLEDGRSARILRAQAQKELDERAARHAALVDEMRDLEAALAALGVDMSVSWVSSVEG